MIPILPSDSVDLELDMTQTLVRTFAQWEGKLKTVGTVSHIFRVHAIRIGIQVLNSWAGLVGRSLNLEWSQGAD